MIRVTRPPEPCTLGIFTPSEPITPTRRDRFNSNIERLRDAGYAVRFAPGYDQSTGYTAGSVHQRVSSFHALIEDPSVDVLLAAWGGKSSAQLLPHLNYASIRASRKPICAFSDGCVILNAVASRANLPTFYGPNVVGKLDETEFWDLAQALGARLTHGRSILPQSNRMVSIAEGVVEGTLFGGNLSSYVLGILGNDYEIPIRNGIFFWESGPKTAQELDTLLTAVRISRVFPRIKGMVIGHVDILAHDVWGHGTVENIVRSVFETAMPILHIPVFGHADLPNPPIPIGAKARLDATAGELTLLSNITR